MNVLHICDIKAGKHFTFFTNQSVHMPVKVNWVLVYVFQNLPFCSVHHDADVIFAYVISHEW